MVVLIIYLWRSRKFIQYLLIIYFLVGFCIIILNYVKPILPQYDDTFRYYIPNASLHANALRKSIIDCIITFDIKDFITGNPGYIYPLSLIFYLSNDSLEVGRLFSLIFGVMTIYVLFKLTEDLFNTRTANFTALILAFSPNFILLSVGILRDIHSIFFLVWFFRLWRLHQDAPTIKVKFFMMLSFIYLGMLRPPVMLVLLCVIILNKTLFQYKKKRLLVARLVQFGVILGLFLGAFVTLHSGSGSSDLRILKGAEYIDIDQMIKRSDSTSDADSGYTGEFRYKNIYEAILFMPILVIYFLGSPFPWMVRKANQALALTDSAVLWFLYIYFILEIKAFYKKDRKWALIIFSFILIGVCSAALVQGNMAGALRHRLLFTVLIIPFAANNILNRFVSKRRKLNNKLIMKSRQQMVKV